MTFARWPTACPTLRASGAPEGTPRISFATPELLWEVLTAECWALLKAIGGAGPISIAEAGQGSIEFPYDTVKVELLRRAA